MKRKLQVFVSSTYTDLTEERQAAVSAILKAGHIPAGMELFTAGDKSQMDTINQWIDESDIYMLILGGRYGSLEQTSGLSYTELEFDYALRNNKPLFSVVMNEAAIEAKAKLLGLGIIERDNQQKLNEFRKKVLSNISSFFSDTKDIKLAVHESLNDISRRQNLVGWVSGHLISQNEELAKKTERLQVDLRALSATRAENDKFKAEIKILKAKADWTAEAQKNLNLISKIEIKVPKNVFDADEDKNIELVILLYHYMENFISGFTNSLNSSKFEIFFFQSVMPRLQVYGLAEESRIPGKIFQIRRLSKAGLQLVALIEQRILSSKGKTTSSSEKEKSE